MIGPVLRALPEGASAQVAAETFGTPQYGGPPLRSVGMRVGAARLRCASLLKPLFVWAAAHCDGPYRQDRERWSADAELAVRVSDNAATNRLWLGSTPPRVLDWIAEATGVRWRVPGADPSWFGAVEVSAAEVVTAYGALSRAAAGDPDAASVLGWMRGVSPEQAFGVLASSADVAVKAGWFGHVDETCLRTHLVAVVEEHGETLVVAALSALPYLDPADRARYRSKLVAGQPLEAEHERVAGPTLRALVDAACGEISLEVTEQSF
ncbi:serine hydrolase [Pseudonocardia spinosispora]|uniref:serine hydrolase n=1 Tax=Pseudonocardia spinosispora TaxID=103441 RepID=UPI0003FC8944|nr:serine hydrolase [Pseudonocardia spinosispora]